MVMVYLKTFPFLGGFPTNGAHPALKIDHFTILFKSKTVLPA